jgi:hypothetical protein
LNKWKNINLVLLLDKSRGISQVLLLGELGGIGTVFLFNKLATFHNRNKFQLFITLYLFVLFCFLELEGWVFVLMCLFLSLGFSVLND